MVADTGVIRYGVLLIGFVPVPVVTFLADMEVCEDSPELAGTEGSVLPNNFLPLVDINKDVILV